MIPENESLSPVAYSATRTIRVQTIQDLDAEDEVFDWSFVVAEGGLVDANDADITEASGSPTTLTIDDDETQSYDLTTDDDAEEGVGNTITVTVTANPAHVNGSADLSVQLDAPRTVASITDPMTATVPTINAASPSQDITIAMGENDKNRVEDTITVKVYSGSVGNSELVDSLSIPVEDANELPAVTMMVVEEDGGEVNPQPESVEEGESIYVAVMVLDKDGDVGGMAGEALEVALTATGMATADDYTLIGDFDIALGSGMSAPVELKVSENNDVGRESLMFGAEVEGDSDIGPGSRMSPGVLVLTIEDKTDQQIIPLSSDAADTVIDGKIADGAGEDGLNPGESFSFEPSELFTSPEGYGAKYTTTVSGDAVSETSSGGSVTITALKAGTSTVTVSGSATMAASSLNASSSQTVAYAADITFDVEVVDKPLVVEVSTDPADMVDEGGTVMVIATSTTRAVLADEDVTVALTVSGPVEGDGHSITIAAGDMMGSTELMVMNDDVVSALSDVVITATGPGIDGAMVVSLSVTEDDEAAPEPTPENVISANDIDDAYPVITGAIEAGAGADGLNPGESFAVMASSLFTVMEGYNATYSVDVVDGNAVVSASSSGGSISVTADAVGDAKVTITGTAKMAASSFAPSQDATNVASITFPVTVVDTPVAVTLSADPMEIDEGGTSMITATASRYVTADDGDVEIALTVVGDGTLDTDSITIAAGAMSGSAMLTATADDDMDNETVTVVASGSGITGNMQVMVTVTDTTEPVVPEPVPALPLIWQLLLGLGLLGGGARQLYRRRRQG